MQNQDDDNVTFDDDVYDDVLDDNFEEEYDGEDEEFLDVELDDDSESGLYEDFGDESEEWENSNDPNFEQVGLGAGSQKKKRGIDLSFNAMAIIAALVIGVGVLVFQVITKKPTLSLDTFTSALNMQGASDGPIFGQDDRIDPDTQNVPLEDSTQETTKGFLYDPEVLNSMEMDVENTPPMPSPISSEEKKDEIPEVVETNVVETTITPLPVEENQENVNQVPRVPDDLTVEELGLADLINNPKTSTVEPQDEAVKNSLKAEEFLKASMEARQAKKNETEQVVEEKVIPQIQQQEQPQPVEEIKVVSDLPKEVVQPQMNIETPKAVASEVQIAQVDKKTEDKLNLILERLDDMEVQITQIRETGNSKIEDISEDLSSLKQEMSSIATVKQAPEVKKEVVAKPKVSSPAPKKASASVKKAAPVKTVSWELRAAQPGKAWVSKKGQKDMQPVVIGDSLSGIGRITAISYNSNRWVVEGTTGRILQ